MKNIVVLSTSYYPEMSASSAVFDKYLQQMKGKYNFHIVTATWFLKYKPLDEPNIKVYYISCLWHKLRAIVESRYRDNPNLINKILIQLFRARTYILWHFLYPLPTKWEIKGYYNKLNDLCKQIKIDVIIPVSGMVNVQFAAMQFKKEHPEIKLITFFTDPFTNLSFIYYPPFGNKEKRREKNKNNEIEIYKTADYNYVLEGHYESALREFQLPDEKSYCMHFPLENIRERIKGIDITKSSSDMRLIYAGRLYKVIRNPEYMLSVVSKTSNIRLDMYVMEHECDDIINKFISDRIVLKGVANRSEYERMICYEYDILVNIGNNSENMAPSKMFELLSTGRPIVNFYYFKDSQYELIELYPLGINIGREDDDAVNKLEKFCKEMKGKQLDFTDVEELFPNNTLSEQVALFEKIIND